ncbi:MAG: DUF5684 domain-containing protein [Planctomycetaceae bacterium]|nr:DUF5684 domain-containing protein [Planctomycetaceae bacterium]
MVAFECSSCGLKKAVDDKYAGRNVRCPKCSASVSVSTQKISQEERPKNLIKVYCPLCNKKIAVSSEYAGKRVRCPNCKNPLTVDAVQPAAPQPQVPQPIPQPVDDVQSLLAMEKQAKPVDLPPELQQTIVQKEIENKTDPGERIGIRPQKTKVKKTETDLPIAALIVMSILIIVFGIVANIKIGSVEKKKAASKQQVKLAEVFASRFIDTMSKGDVNEISPMLTQELQQQDSNTVLKPLIDTFKSNWNSNYMLSNSLSVQEPQGNFFMFGHSQQLNQAINIVTIISQKSDKFEIIGLNFYTRGDSPIRFESSECRQITSSFGSSLAYKIIVKLKKSLVVLLVLFAASRLSKAVVFHRAGESPWAAMIPVFHEWTLAETGDKSGVWGLAAVLLGGIPFVYLAFMFYFSIGIAEAYGRGILFGIGLCLLPFIFYPILVFSEN